MTAFQLPPKSPDAMFADFRHAHVCLRVPDYEAAKSWFVDKLDFRVVHEWPEPMLGVQMGYLAAADDNGTILEIVGGNDPAASPSRPQTLCSPQLIPSQARSVNARKTVR
jgi:glyoxylase I family protein